MEISSIEINSKFGTDTTLNICLESKLITLKEVIIKKRKNLYDVSDEKIIYYYSKDSAAQSLPILNAMRNLPFISIDPRGNIKYLNGHKEIVVVLNGKKTYITHNPSEVLKSFPSTAVASFELIFNPSAKYRIQGFDAVLNIKTKENIYGLIYSTNESLSSTLEYTSNQFVLSKFKKYYISANAGYSYMNEDEHTSVERFYGGQKKWREESNQSPTTKILNLNSEFGYDIDSFQSTGMYITWQQQREEGDNYIITDQYPFNFDKRIDLHTINKFTDQSLTAGGYYQKLSTIPYKELSFSYQYKYTPEHKYNEIFTESSKTSSHLNEAWSREHIAQFNYNLPFNEKYRMENTIKAVFRKYNSDYYSERDSLGFWVKDQNISGHMHYLQGIYTMLNNFNFKFNQYRIIFQNKISYVKEDHGKSQLEYTPGISFSKLLNGRRILRINYNYKIKRPGLYYLNSFTNRIDPVNIWKGNSDLRPEVFHTVDVGYNTFFKGKSLYLNLYTSFGSNLIQSITSLEQGAEQSRAQYFNLGKSFYSILYGYYRANIYRNWRVNASVGIGYQQESDKSTNRFNEDVFYTVNINSSYALTKNLTLQVLAFLNSKTVTLQGYHTGSNMSTVSIHKRFKNKRGTLSFLIHNPFQSRKEVFYMIRDYTGRQEKIRSRIGRKFELAFSYQFGTLFTRPYYRGRKAGMSDLKGRE